MGPILQNSGLRQKGKGFVQLRMIERIGTEEVKVERLPMPQHERNGGAALQDQPERGRGPQLWPQLLLCHRENVRTGSRAPVHRKLLRGVSGSCSSSAWPRR